MSAPLLECDDVAAIYPGASVPAVASATFAVRAGERVAVLGPNGGGKSTLFRILTGELATSAGRITARGAAALVPQTDRSRLDFPVSALDVALMGALGRRPWWRRPSRADRAVARDALERVGLGELAQLTFGDLSGGQRQRVLIARALVEQAPLLLLDEPYAGLDAVSAERLDRLLAELVRDGRGLMLATHDLEQARGSDLVLCLNRVQIAFGPPAVLSAEVIERTYGAQILTLPGEQTALAIVPAHHHAHEHEGGCG